MADAITETRQRWAPLLNCSRNAASFASVSDSSMGLERRKPHGDVLDCGYEQMRALHEREFKKHARSNKMGRTCCTSPSRAVVGDSVSRRRAEWRERTRTYPRIGSVYPKISSSITMEIPPSFQTHDYLYAYSIA